MKLQYLAVIFVIIMLPISLVLSFYVQAQIDIINIQSQYRTKLSDATYDAVKSFQLNTTNSYYSGVSDSKIRDIEASVNTFYNALTSSLRYSKEDLQACVPAIVYTLYDGYYIYGKRYNVLNIKDTETRGTEKIISKIEIDTGTGDTNKYDYGLKPFVYYSCGYKTENSNFVINYTLDNFISVYGDVYCYNEKTDRTETHYVTRSGYLIKPLNWTDEKYYKGIEIKNEGDSQKEYLKFIDDSENGIVDGEYSYIVYQSQKIYRKNDDAYFYYEKGKSRLVNDATIIDNVKKQMNRDTDTDGSAIKYYKDAYDFSTWFYNNIGNQIKQDHVRLSGESETNTNRLDYNAGSEFIFDPDEDPEDEGSRFNQHRMAVIKKSIETNLITAISSYNSNANSYEFRLPQLSVEDWEKVTNNVCVISFLQGLPMKGKYFNSYAVIPNDRNNEFVDTDAIYLLTNDGKYHMPNCPSLVEDEDEQDKITIGYINTSFEAQTLEKSGSENEYYYKHVRGYDAEGKPLYYTSCYQCIVNVNGKYDLDKIINATNNKITGKDSSGRDIDFDIEALRSKYLTALAREKYDLYKTNN